jgi:hypothetical protein
MRNKQTGKVVEDMKREYRLEVSVSHRDMACAMSRCNVVNSAERFSIALRSYFFGFWFMKIPIRESYAL